MQGVSGDNAVDAAAVVASGAPQARPWEDPRGDSGDLEAASLSLSAWIETTCVTSCADLVRCDFKWLNATGLLADDVDTGAASTWSVSAAATDDSAVRDPDAKPNDDAGQCPVRRRFQKASPEIVGTCAFVRQLAGLRLAVNVTYPGPTPPPLPVSESPEPAPDAAAAKAAPDAAAAKKAKGKAAVVEELDDPLKPKPPELTKQFSFALAPLLVSGRKGLVPEIVEDVGALLAGAGEGLQGFRIGVTCSGPLLSDEVRAYLNPMLFTVETAHKLPSEQHLGQTRQEVVAVLNAFGERRVTEAQGINLRGAAKFQFHSVFFVGTWKQREFRDFLQTERFAIEVHDRGKPSPVATSGNEEEPACTPRGTPLKPAAHFGVARFSLAELLNMRRAWPLSLRVNLEHAAVGSGASGSVLGKVHRGAGSADRPVAEFRQALFGEGAQELMASLDTPRAEFAPAYIQNDAYVTLSVTLAQSLHPKPLPDRPLRLGSPGGVEEAEGAVASTHVPAEVQPAGAPARYERYRRLVMVMNYRMSSLAKNLISIVQENNIVAADVDEAQARGLAAVELTQQQRGDETLDILTGFVLIDRRTRIVVIEGLCDGAAWPKLLDVAGVGRERMTRKCRILYHPGVGFRHRMYTDFNLCLKQIKIRARTLEKLIHRSDLYDDTRSEKEASSTLMRLAELKRVERLHNLKASTSFPTASGLLAVEMQYGDFVTDAELVGGCTSRDRNQDHDAGTDGDGSSTSRSRSSSRTQTLIPADLHAHLHEDSDEGLAESVRSKSRHTNKEGLNTTNHAYRKSMTLRMQMGEPNFKVRNKESVSVRSIENSARNPFDKKVPDSSFLEGLAVFTYSGQKLNSAELQKQALRKKMAGKDELWTYSKDKNTGCFPLLDHEVDLANVLRAPDPNFKDDREAFRYPKTRDRSEYVKPYRDVSDQRREDLKEAWDEPGERLALKAGVVHNAFDAKSLGIGGAHVIKLRRPGIRQLDGTTRLPPTRLEMEEPRCPRIQKDEMRFPHQNNMGSMNMVDKYHAQMLEGKPASKGLTFTSRRVSDSLYTKYGETMHRNPANCEAAPVSIQVDEDFHQAPMNSLFPSEMARFCARELVCKPPLSARDKREKDAAAMKQTGTLATWQKPCLSGKTQTFQKPAFVPQAVPRLPLSAR